MPKIIRKKDGKIKKIEEYTKEELYLKCIECSRKMRLYRQARDENKAEVYRLKDKLRKGELNYPFHSIICLAFENEKKT